MVAKAANVQPRQTPPKPADVEAQRARAAARMEAAAAELQAAEAVSAALDGIQPTAEAAPQQAPPVVNIVLSNGVVSTQVAAPAQPPVITVPGPQQQWPDVESIAYKLAAQTAGQNVEQQQPNQTPVHAQAQTNQPTFPTPTEIPPGVTLTPKNDEAPFVPSTMAELRQQRLPQAQETWPDVAAIFQGKVPGHIPASGIVKGGPVVPVTTPSLPPRQVIVEYAQPNPAAAWEVTQDFCASLDGVLCEFKKKDIIDQKYMLDALQKGNCAFIRPIAGSTINFMCPHCHRAGPEESFRIK